MENSYINYNDDNNLFISIKEDKTHLTPKLHFHSAYEIYLTHSGPMSCLINNSVYDLMPNDMLVFAPSDIHMGIKPKNSNYVSTVLNFNPSKVARLSDRVDLLLAFSASAEGFSHKVSLTQNQAEIFLAKLGDLNDIKKSKDEYRDIRQQIVLAEILLFMHEIYAGNAEKKSARRVKNDELVFNILKHITQNVSGNLSLESLCEKFYLSKNILNKNFKEKTGYTLGTYIVNYRMYCARQIIESGESVSAAAWKVGYNNTSNFIRTYKKVLGVTPGAYKNRL